MTTNLYGNIVAVLVIIFMGYYLCIKRQCIAKCLCHNQLHTFSSSFNCSGSLKLNCAPLNSPGDFDIVGTGSTFLNCFIYIQSVHLHCVCYITQCNNFCKPCVIVAAISPQNSTHGKVLMKHHKVT